jgi:hypothetical protein
MMNAAEEEKVISQLMNNYPEKKSIEEKISKVKSETKKEQIEKLDEITYNNKTVPLKTDKLK